VRLAQCPHDAKVGKTTRAAGTQDEADRCSSQEPREAGDIIWIAVANMTNDIDWRACAPALYGWPDIPLSLMQQDKVKRLAAILTVLRQRCGHREWQAG
jgi:hypothetical protein